MTRGGQINPSSSQKSRAWIELDIGRLRSNASVIKNLLPVNCELMPSVKANAHGHGAVEICQELNKIGVRAFCVASVMEGVELRKHHIEGTILIFGYTHPDQFSLLKRYNLTQTVVDLEYAEKLNAYGKRLTVHVKIDTGMNRLGEHSDNEEGILRILNYKNLHVGGVYSHFSAQNNSDPAHKSFTRKQLEKFNRVLAMIEENGHGKPKTHLQGSFGVFNHPDLKCDYARPGMALYGVYQNGKPDEKTDGKPDEKSDGKPDVCENKLLPVLSVKNGVCHNGKPDETLDEKPDAREKKLLPVLSVKARVAAVKTISAGDAVGYELAFVASRDMKIASLSIGYADGLPRALSCGKGRVLVGGSFAPILGNICMDQTIVDVTGIERVKQGDIAVIIGKDGKEEISAYDIAEQAGTIPNEIVGRLGGRLERCKTGEQRERERERELSDYLSHNAS